jgi:acetyl-CoA carboxylase biotin carboxyl carrier protein
MKKSSKKNGTSPSKGASAAPKKKSTLPFDLDSIGELSDFLKSKGIAEFEWSKGDTKIALKTGSVHAVMTNSVLNMPQTQAPQSGVGVAAPAETLEPASHKKVLSPFVGTFYRSPSPTAPLYTDMGKRVSVGDTLCIIEAMKLMNEIEADFAGKVVQILVENGQPVEFGEPLFVIDTA